MSKQVYKQAVTGISGLMRQMYETLRIVLLPGNFGQMILGACTAMLAATAAANLGPECGTLDNAYGPFDYSNAMHRQERLEIVEGHHFNSSVQNLTGGAAGAPPIVSDLDFTLRAFPNHHKALYAVIKYDLSEDPRHQKPLILSAECYMQRAITWQPGDGRAHLLYGIYKARKGDLDEAKTLFYEAERLLPDSGEVRYNIGLVMAKSGDYTEALRHAQAAYRLGFPLPGLRNILKRAGYWQDLAPLVLESGN